MLPRTGIDFSDLWGSGTWLAIGLIKLYLLFGCNNSFITLALPALLLIKYVQYVFKIIDNVTRLPNTKNMK